MGHPLFYAAAFILCVVPALHDFCLAGAFATRRQNVCCMTLLASAGEHVLRPKRRPIVPLP